MHNTNSAVQTMSWVLTLGAVLNFALAAMFAFTDVVNLGDDFVTKVIAAALVFSGIATLAIKPVLLNKIRANQEE